MRDRYNVLFLCTENSASSILAEAILNHKGRRNFRAYSAGARPKGYVHPEALRQLEAVCLPTEGLRSKSWNEFTRPDAPQMDFVFAVCEDGKNCPAWPGRMVTGEWHVPDPTSTSGTREEIERAFREAFSILQRRIDLLLCLPPAKLDTLVIPGARERRAA